MLKVMTEMESYVPEYLKLLRLYRLLASELKVTEALLLPFLFTRNLLLFFTSNQTKSVDAAIPKNQNTLITGQSQLFTPWQTQALKRQNRKQKESFLPQHEVRRENRLAKHIQRLEQPVTVRAAEMGRGRALATPRKGVDQSDCANKQTTTV
jgi:hypothetical protein